MDKDNQYFDNLEKEINDQAPAQERFAVKPNSLICKFGFHKWRRWSIETVQVVNERGEKTTHYTVLQRRCIRCEFLEHKNYM